MLNQEWRSVSGSFADGEMEGENPGAERGEEAGGSDRGRRRLEPAQHRLQAQGKTLLELVRVVEVEEHDVLTLEALDFGRVGVRARLEVERDLVVGVDLDLVCLAE